MIYIFSYGLSYHSGPHLLTDISLTSIEIRTWVSYYKQLIGWEVNDVESLFPYRENIYGGLGHASAVYPPSLYCLWKINGTLVFHEGNLNSLVLSVCCAKILFATMVTYCQLSPGRNLNGISIKIHQFALKEIILKMSTKWRRFCVSLKLLRTRLPTSVFPKWPLYCMECLAQFPTKHARSELLYDSHWLLGTKETVVKI